MNSEAACPIKNGPKSTQAKRSRSGNEPKAPEVLPLKKSTSIRVLIDQSIAAQGVSVSHPSRLYRGVNYAIFVTVVVFVDGSSTGIDHPLVGLVATGDPIPPVAVQRIGCDATVAAAPLERTGGDAEPGGAAVRTVTDAQARALWVRDGGCVFPGCARPPAACEAHQIPSVPDGGGDLADLCLLCVAHHRLLHEGGFGVSRSADGRRDASIAGRIVCASQMGVPRRT